MTTKPDGGPAFPSWAVYDDRARPVAEGDMTLRQYAAIKLRVPDSGLPWLDEMIEKAQRNEYAGLAMQGHSASPFTRLWDGETTARGSVCYADALMAELKK